VNLESEEGIATNLLSDRLRRMEKAGIVLKEVDPDNRKKFVYRLTEKGRDLLSLLLDMVLWGATHDAKTAAPEEFVRRLKRDREGVIREFRSRMRES
jgi:DNA-binding HxlR family transcriptional regulator